MTRVLTSTGLLIRSLACTWDIDWRGSPAAQGISGIEQIVFNQMPRWTGAPQLRLAQAQIAAFRALRHAGQGRVAVWRVPMVDEDGLGSWATDIPWGEGALGSGPLWSGGVGWAFAPSVGCADGAAAGAEAIVVQETDHALRVGQFVSHDDWPYTVTWLDRDGDNCAIGLAPPLRRGVPAGATIDLRAHGLFRLASDTAGNPVYDRRFVATPEIAFVEWMGPERFA